MYVSYVKCFSEAENGEVWYYTTEQQFQELLSVLDSEEMEAPLVRELEELKEEILRQMDITERLTNQVKGNRKSYLEVENSKILKQRKLREDFKHNIHNIDNKFDDVKSVNITSLDADADIDNEVTIMSEDSTHEDNDVQEGSEDDDSKKLKNNVNKTKAIILKKNEESE